MPKPHPHNHQRKEVPVKKIVAYATITVQGDVEVLLEGDTAGQLPRNKVVVQKNSVRFNTMCLRKLIDAGSKSGIDDTPEM